MTTDDEYWAAALDLDRAHGVDAPRLVGERTVASRFSGDDAGVRRHREIAVRLDQLHAAYARVDRRRRGDQRNPGNSLTVLP